MKTENHSWIDRQEYPFESHWMPLEAGNMHYVEEGKGPTLLFLHGNPVWSFSYRKLIRALSNEFHCVAIDHIGFGLSDKPSGFSYLPEDHSKNLEEFLAKKGLKNITLFVNDWGGPIGLNYAVNHPENISRLVIFNTFMWPVKGDKHYERFSGFMGGKLGRFLNLNFNFFGRFVIPKAWGDKSKLDKKIHRQLIRHTPEPEDRKGVWVFPKAIIGSTDWLNSIWEKRKQIENKPALLIWGMKDIAFRKQELERFCSFLHNHRYICLEDTGHYVQDEAGDRIVPDILDFLKQTADAGRR